MGLILFWLFNLKIQVCTQQVTLIPYTQEQKVEICLKQILKDEELWKKEKGIVIF